MDLGIVMTIVSLAASVSGIVFAVLAFKRSERQEHRVEGKSEGLMLSDIGYIKACVDRMEKNLANIDERYRNMAERLVKAEENLFNLQKRVEQITEKGG